MERLTSCLGVGVKTQVCTCICIYLKNLFYLLILALSTVHWASNTDLCILAKEINGLSDLKPVVGRAYFVSVECRLYSRDSRRFWAQTHGKRNFINSGTEGFLVRC